MCGKDCDYVGHMLGVCGQMCRQRMDRNLQKYDITPAQAHVILYLIETEGQGEVNQKDLEKQFQIKASTVNGIVERLEDKGFLTRTPGKHDGRCRQLTVTEKGRQLKREMTSIVSQTEELMVQDFTAEEKAQLRGMLGRMIANLRGGTMDL